MANNRNNIQNLKPFKKGHDKRRNITGANRKSWSAFNLKCKAEGIEPLTKNELTSTLNYIFNLTESEIEQFKNDVELPYYLRLLLTDFTDKKIGAKIRQDYRDYIFGKAQQDVKTDHTSNGKEVIDWTTTDYSKLTKEERAAYVALQDKANGISF